MNECARYRVRTPSLFYSMLHYSCFCVTLARLNLFWVCVSLFEEHD